MLLTETISRWITRREINLAPSTISGYRRIVTKYIEPTTAGQTEIADLDEDDMVDLLRPLLVAEHTRQAQILQVLIAAALKDAMRHRLIRWNPMDCIDHVKHKSVITAWLTIDQSRQLLRSSRDSNDPWYVAWLLMLVCGLRRGEMLGLKWSDIDWDQHVIHIERQQIRVDGQILETKPKTLSGIRTIYVDDLLLNELRLQNRQGDYILDGRTPEAMADALDKAVKRANVPRITPHGLRHSMASAAVAEGVQVKTLQSLMGHAHYQTTADIYSHVDQSAYKSAARQLAKAVIPARLEIA